MPSIITFLRNPKWFLPIGCVVFCIGLFVSRAMMSMGMMTIFVTAFIQPNAWSFLKNEWKQKHVLWMTVYFLAMGISLFYSENRSYGLGRLLIALPFLVLPISFSSLKRYSGEWVHGLLSGFIFLIALGNLYSLIIYVSHKEAIDASYIFSKVIPTPFKNDHIRYSLAVVLSIIFGMYLLDVKKWKGLHYTIGACLLLSVVYLHILSAKTGLLSFYLMAVVAGIHYVFNRPKRKYGILILFITLVVPFISYYSFSSFRNKLSYVRYSIEQIKNNTRQTNISDEGRLLSYHFAWQSIREHPATGVGIGDVMDEMKKKYEAEMPDTGSSILLPHNQFLMAWMSGGLLQLSALLLLIFYWLKNMWRKGLYHRLVFLVLFIPTLFEPLFETQYGSGLFVFFLLLWELVSGKEE